MCPSWRQSNNKNSERTKHWKRLIITYVDANHVRVPMLIRTVTFVHLETIFRQNRCLRTPSTQIRLSKKNHRPA